MDNHFHRFYSLMLHTYNLADYLIQFLIQPFVLPSAIFLVMFVLNILFDDYPYELVKSKFLKLNSSHLEYVPDDN